MDTQTTPLEPTWREPPPLPAWLAEQIEPLPKLSELISFKPPKSAYNHMTAKGRARRS